MSFLRVLLLVAGLRAVAAGPSVQPRDVTPVVKATTSYGNLDDGNFNRDSCTSTAWSGNNVLWTCRDTQLLNSAGVPVLPIVANTASWSTKPSATTSGPLTLDSPQG